MRLPFCAFILVIAASAQSISIAKLPSGSSVTPGQPFSVELDFPDTLTGIRHASLIISHIACEMQMCDTHDGANASRGDVLYSGDFTPSCSDDPAKPPHQKFTVTPPTGILAGSSLLNVAHFMFIGTEAQPIVEFKNVSLIVRTPMEDRESRYRVAQADCGWNVQRFALTTSLAKTRWFWTTFIHDVLSVIYLCFVLATDLNRDL